MRLKSSLEAALGIQYINRLASDVMYIKNEERKGFVEISDEDLDFKQSELKKERSKLSRRQKERERVQKELAEFKEHAGSLAKRIVRVVEEPEPIYRETLSAEKMVELEQRICKVLREGDSKYEVVRILDLSDRDAARVLNKMETLENGDVFLLKPLLEEKRELISQIRKIEAMSQAGLQTESEQELFDQLQAEMESCSTQMGRKSEQMRLLEDEILSLEKRITDLEIEIERLYERHHISKDRAEFIEECDAIGRGIESIYCATSQEQGPPASGKNI